MNTIQRASQMTSRYKAGRSTFYLWIKEGLWPRPIKLGPRASAWFEEENDSVIDARAAGQSDAAIRSLVDEIHANRLGKKGIGVQGEVMVKGRDKPIRIFEVKAG